MFAAAKYGLLRKMSYNKNDKKILYKNHKCFSIFLNNKKQQLHSKRQPQVLSFPEQHRDKGVYNICSLGMFLQPFRYQQIRQYRKKSKKGDKFNIKTYIANENIKHREVQILDNNNKLSAPMQRNEAINVARDNGLDLILLNVSKQNKVVCKFDDLTKLQYKARRKAAEDRLNNIEKNKREKTVKFKSNMGENDIERQINQIKKFLRDNHAVIVDIWLLRRWNVKHESFEKSLDLAHRIIEQIELDAIGQPRDLRKDFKDDSKYFVPVANNKIVFSFKPINIDLNKLAESKNRDQNKKRKTKKQKLRIQREESFKIKSKEASEENEVASTQQMQKTKKEKKKKKKKKKN